MDRQALKTFKGLIQQPNSFNPEDVMGSFEVFDNVYVSKDNIVSKRRGFATWSTPAANVTYKNITYYDNKLIAIANATSGNPAYSIASTGTPTTLTAYTGTPTTTISFTPRSAQANKNLYFTTDKGIYKLTSGTSTYEQSGVPPGLDLTSKWLNVNTGEIPPNSQVAHRALFSKTDANGSLLLSAPTAFAVLINNVYADKVWSQTTTTLTITDSTHPFTAADVGTRNLYILTSSRSAQKKVSTVPNAGWTITAVTVGVSFAVTVSESFTGGGAATDILTYGVFRTPVLDFTLPEQIQTTDYIYQIYRSSNTYTDIVSVTTGENLAAPSDYALIDETNIGSADITAGYIRYVDELPDSLRNGAELYTNPGNREGEAQANFRAPYSADLTLYKNYLFFSDCTTLQRLTFGLITTTGMTGNNATDSNNTLLSLLQGATTNTYRFRTGVGNRSVNAESVSYAGSTLTINYTAHNLQVGDVINVRFTSGITGTLSGSYTIATAATNSFTITAAGLTLAATRLVEFEGLTNTGGDRLVYLAATASVGINLQETVLNLVKAINRNGSSVADAFYTSAVQGVPGQMAIASKNPNEAVIQVKISTTGAGNAFIPAIPTAYSTTFQSKADSQPSSMYFSKLNEPEAVPLVNFINIGSSTSRILRVLALRDSLIILKEDGVFRLNGDSPAGFSVTALDNTIICASANSAAVLNNTVFCLSNQGVVRISESDVQIMSRQIEPLVVSILGQSGLNDVTFGVAYEAERLYLLTTKQPNSAILTTYCYNYLTNAWSTWDKLCTGGVVNPTDNVLYLLSNDAAPTVYKERKLYQKTDYCDESYSTTCVSVATGGMTATMTLPGAIVPQAGDVLVYNDTIHRILTATPSSGTDYILTFGRSVNFVATNSVTLYGRIVSTMRTSPLHGEDVGNLKVFSQLQLHFRAFLCSKLSIDFGNEKFNSTGAFEWSASLDSGWGFGAWGFSVWGDEEALDIPFKTSSAPILRTYVNRDAARGTFLQCIFVHSLAAEPLDLQEITLYSRPYKARVSK